MHGKQEASHDKAKKRYDVGTRVVLFAPGDLVLALQNVNGKPLATKFDGPFRVLRKIMPVDYLVEFTGHRKSERQLHVNMLNHILEKNVVRKEFVGVCESVSVDLDCVDDDDDNKGMPSSVS